MLKVLLILIGVAALYYAVFIERSSRTALFVIGFIGMIVMLVKIRKRS